jgi:uncharacterized protein (TIGR02284 family)
MSYRMNELQKQDIDELQELIRVNIDSCNLFDDAAKQIDHPQVSALFRDIAHQRRANAAELTELVQAAGGAPEEHGSFGGQTREVWLKFRSALNGGDPYIVLVEAERSEDHVKEEYEEAIRKTGGSPASQALHHQFARIKQQHDAVRDLRDAHKQKKR